MQFAISRHIRPAQTTNVIIQLLCVLTFARSASAQVSVGDTVRIKPRHGDVIIGAVQRFGADSISLVHGKAELSVLAKQQIKRIEIRETLHRNPTAWVLGGTLVGGVIFGALGAFDASQCVPSPSLFFGSCPTVHEEATAGAVLGSLSGFVFGLVHGNQKHRWKKVEGIGDY